MNKPLLIFAALLSGLPAFAAVIAAGAGSYADTVSPTSYGCVVDYGNWVTNAGVVQPGIAGCQPQADYNGVPVGTPVKLFPQLVGRAALEPTATHRWWGSIAFYGEGQVNGSGAGYLTLRVDAGDGGDPRPWFALHVLRGLCGYAGDSNQGGAGPEKEVFHQSANSVGMWTDVASVRNHFMVVAEGATTFNNLTASETSLTPANGRFTLRRGAL